MIAEVYLAGLNTRRVRQALAKLLAGHLGKDVVSRAWWLRCDGQKPAGAGQS